jgi:hypothetical protein
MLSVFIHCLTVNRHDTGVHLRLAGWARYLPSASLRMCSPHLWPCHNQWMRHKYYMYYNYYDAAVTQLPVPAL